MFFSHELQMGNHCHGLYVAAEGVLWLLLPAVSVSICSVWLCLAFALHETDFEHGHKVFGGFLHSCNTALCDRKGACKVTGLTFVHPEGLRDSSSEDQIVPESREPQPRIVSSSSSV